MVRWKFFATSEDSIRTRWVWICEDEHNHIVKHSACSFDTYAGCLLDALHDGYEKRESSEVATC